MSPFITKPLPKPKAEEEARRPRRNPQETETEAVEAEAEDVLTHLRRKGMKIPTKTQEMTRVFSPAVDEPPRLHP